MKWYKHKEIIALFSNLYIYVKLAEEQCNFLKLNSMLDSFSNSCYTIVLRWLTWNMWDFYTLPWCSLETYLFFLLWQAGLPPGVLNVVSGYGPSDGAALASHMDVEKVFYELLVSCQLSREIESLLHYKLYSTLKLNQLNMSLYYNANVLAFYIARLREWNFVPICVLTVVSTFIHNFHSNSDTLSMSSTHEVLCGNHDLVAVFNFLV